MEDGIEREKVSERFDWPGRVFPNGEKLSYVNSDTLRIDGVDFEGKEANMGIAFQTRTELGRVAMMMRPAREGYHLPGDAAIVHRINTSDFILAVADGVSLYEGQKAVNSGRLARKVLKSLQGFRPTKDPKGLKRFLDERRRAFQMPLAETTVQAMRVWSQKDDSYGIETVTCGSEKDLGYFAFGKPDGSQARVYGEEIRGGLSFYLAGGELRSTNLAVPRGTRVLLTTDPFTAEFDNSTTKILQKLNSLFTVGDSISARRLLMEMSPKEPDDATLVLLDLG